MNSWSLLVYGAVVTACMAQHACAAQESSEAVALQGAFVRPTDGFDHPNLNQAWANYQAAIDEATDLVENGLRRSIDAARKREDLDTVNRLHAALSRFQDQGILPAAQFLNAGAVNVIRRANADLLDAYGDVKGALIKGDDIPNANTVLAERGGLEAGLGFPPIPNVPEPLFDGKEWNLWGQGWGAGHHEVIAKEKAVRLIKDKYFAFQQLIMNDFAFELDVRNHAWGFKDGMVQVGIQTNVGACLIRVPERNAQGQVIPGWGEVINYDDIKKQDQQLARFAIPRSTKKWQTIYLERVGGNLSVFIDGKQVVKHLPVPGPLQEPCNPHIGVSNGTADFKDLKLIQIK